MEKERRIKILSIIALIVAILGLTVAFAALSETLTINGTASVDAASWDIHLQNLQEAKITGTAKELSKPVLTNDSLTGINVSVMKPGDKITYNFEIINNGTITAVEGNPYITLNGFSIDEVTDENIEILESLYTEADWDGDGQTTLDERKKTMQFFHFSSEMSLTNKGSENDLVPGEVGTIEFSIVFESSATEIPKGNMVLNFDIEYNFVQQ